MPRAKPGSPYGCGKSTLKAAWSSQQLGKSDTGCSSHQRHAVGEALRERVVLRLEPPRGAWHAVPRLLRDHNTTRLAPCRAHSLKRHRPSPGHLIAAARALNLSAACWPLQEERGPWNRSQACAQVPSPAQHVRSATVTARPCLSSGATAVRYDDGPAAGLERVANERLTQRRRAKR